MGKTLARENATVCATERYLIEPVSFNRDKHARRELQPGFMTGRGRLACFKFRIVSFPPTGQTGRPFWARAHPSQVFPMPVGPLSQETPEVVKVSTDTVMRDWKTARAWLLTELSGLS